MVQGKTIWSNLLTDGSEEKLKEANTQKRKSKLERIFGIDTVKVRNGHTEISFFQLYFW